MAGIEEDWEFFWCNEDERRVFVLLRNPDALTASGPPCERELKNAK